MQKHLEALTARGVWILAISVDPAEISRQHAEKQGYTYTFLSDEKAEVIRRYDLLHEHGGPTGDIARPAEFLIDSTGTIRWSNLAKDYRVRLQAEEILKVLDQLERTPPNPSS
ncbi:MAG: redoxin domain-containing protein [Acidobacteria bacterium]|nr:redoxin domain-containing protein [Acidobacteriota bacterium]